MSSVWSATASLPHFPQLKKDLSVDVLVIGGGMAGILCTWKLSQAGVSCALLEAEEIGGGITQNTTAKLTSQHGLIYHKIMKRYGTEKAQLYLDANEKALEEFRRLCGRDGIDCDFEEKPAYTYSLQDPRILEKELEALRRIGFPAEFAENLPLPFSVAGTVCFPRQAQFHPLKFLASLAKGLPIYEHSKVIELAPHQAATENAVIHADQIIIATHFPMLNKHGSYFLKQYQHRSYVIALSPDASDRSLDVNGMYVDESKSGLSFRNYGSQLLLGGGSHRTGKKGGNWAQLEQFASSAYPGASITAQWAAQDCMTLDGIPYIGPYSRSTAGLYTATGFNKWGMTSSMAAADLLTDLVLGRKNPYAALFSPSRTMLHPQLLLNGLEATKNLLTPTRPRCPHLGCALKWNPDEHSWDCPCHGSRFTKDGRLIDNPASGDLKAPPRS